MQFFQFLIFFFTGFLWIPFRIQTGIITVCVAIYIYIQKVLIYYYLVVSFKFEVRNQWYLYESLKCSITLPFSLQWAYLIIVIIDGLNLLLGILLWIPCFGKRYVFYLTNTKNFTSPTTSPKAINVEAHVETQFFFYLDLATIFLVNEFCSSIIVQSP